MVEVGKKADKLATLAYIDSLWDSWFVKCLCKIIKTPNLTQMVNNEYPTNGLVVKAIQLMMTT